jgi:curved DNA-binding protein CbpA
MKKFRFRCFIKTQKFNLNTNVLYDENLDYYQVLEIKQTADQIEIKQGYLKLAKIHHPDLKGEEAKFKQINQAYEILRNENDKQIYDELRKEYLSSRTKKFNSAKNSTFRRGNEKKYARTKKQYSKSHNQEERKYYEEMYRQYKESNDYGPNDQQFRQKSKTENESEDYNTQDDILKEFEERMKRLYEENEKMYKSSKAYTESHFNKLKINYSFSSYDPIYSKFTPTLKNRHHKENRRKQLLKSSSEENPFKLPNELIKDADFMEIISRKDDSYSYNERFTLRKFIAVNSKLKVSVFLLILTLNTLFLFNKFC